MKKDSLCRITWDLCAQSWLRNGLPRSSGFIRRYVQCLTMLQIVLYSTSSGTKKTAWGGRQEDEQVARVEGEGDRLQGELQHIRRDVHVLQMPFRLNATVCGCIKKSHILFPGSSWRKNQGGSLWSQWQCWQKNSAKEIQTTMWSQWQVVHQLSSQSVI